MVQAVACRYTDCNIPARIAPYEHIWALRTSGLLLTFEDGTDKFSRNVGKELPLPAT